MEVDRVFDDFKDFSTLSGDQDSSDDIKFQKPIGRPYRSNHHTTNVFNALQTFRVLGMLCDTKLETDDGTIINGHKVILASVSPYFHSMFTKFEDKYNNHYIIRKMNSTALKLLINYIYTSQITVTEDNVQVLLLGAKCLQLQYVLEVCCDFLQTQLRPTNCLSINVFAHSLGCMELASYSDYYIRHRYLEVGECDQFLTLSSDQVVKLISNDELNAPEEKVFENIIRWVKYNLVGRKRLLPKLLEHVRLPLASKEYLLKSVNEEPLLKNNLECKDYIIEALHFHLLNSDEQLTIPQTIRTKPRKPVVLPKVIVVAGGFTPETMHSIEWFDLATEQWHPGPEMNMPQNSGAAFTVLNENHMYAVGGFNGTEVDNTIVMLDLSSKYPCWLPIVNRMSTDRESLGLAQLNNCIYVVGGSSSTHNMLSAEVFDCSTQEWRTISNMSTQRSSVGVAFLNNHLYAVGGYAGDSEPSVQCLKSVEYYDPSKDIWTLVADMNVCRWGAGVGVLDGVLYAVGGYDGDNYLKSVEAYKPSNGVWTYVSDMHVRRQNAGVVAYDGLLYVLGGCNVDNNLNSVETYNPIDDTWSVITSMSKRRCFPGAFVIDKPQHFKTN